MAIALQILKIIGIVLLWVIGILLGLLLLILFWPYGYRIGASKKENIRANAGITWLLHFLTADLIYEDGVNLRIRILGIPVYDKKKKAAREEERERREAEKEKKRREAERAKAETEPGPDLPKEQAGEEEPELDFLKEQAGEEEPELDFLKEQTGADTLNEKENPETPGDETGKEGRLSVWKRRLNDRRARRERRKNRDRAGDNNKKKRRKKPDFPEWCEEKIDLLEEKAEELIDRIEDGAWDLGDTIDGAFDTYHYYERVLESEGTAWVVDYVKKHGMAILKPLIPKRFDLDLDYRSTDPVHVAKVMEYYALSIPLTQDIRGKILVTALPDEDSVEGETKLKGSFILGVLLWHAFLLWKNKKVRHFIKVIKREQEAGGKENGGKQK